MLCDNLEGWVVGDGREVPEGGDMCILMNDAHYTAEMNTL